MQDPLGQMLKVKKISYKLSNKTAIPSKQNGFLYRVAFVEWHIAKTIAIPSSVSS